MLQHPLQRARGKLPSYTSVKGTDHSRPRSNHFGSEYRQGMTCPIVSARGSGESDPVLDALGLNRRKNGFSTVTSRPWTPPTHSGIVNPTSQIQARKPNVTLSLPPPEPAACCDHQRTQQTHRTKRPSRKTAKQTRPDAHPDKTAGQHDQTPTSSKPPSKHDQPPAPAHFIPLPDVTRQPVTLLIRVEPVRL